jgi:O-6-methylguanine DNA methyltransferase
MATAFQRSVWKALEQIPSGKVTSYGAIAAFLDTKAVRAVGSAVGKNPNAPEVPCHRVVRADGKIGNYSGGEGIPTKITLLSAEGVMTKAGRIVDFEKVFWSF